MKPSENTYAVVGAEDHLLGGRQRQPRAEELEERQHDGRVVRVLDELLRVNASHRPHVHVVGDEVDEDDGGVVRVLRLHDDVADELHQQRVSLHALVQVRERGAQHAALAVAGQLAHHRGVVADAQLDLSLKNACSAHLLLGAVLVHREQLAAVEQADQVAVHQNDEVRGERNVGAWGLGLGVLLWRIARRVGEQGR